MVKRVTRTPGGTEDTTWTKDSRWMEADKTGV